MTTAENSESLENVLDGLAESIPKVAVEDATGKEQQTGSPDRTALPTPRPLTIYSRFQLVHLHNSPLVGLPPDMPMLKDWYGYGFCFALLWLSVLLILSFSRSENEQNLSKKETEPSASANPRDRRYISP